MVCLLREVREWSGRGLGSGPAGAEYELGSLGSLKSDLLI